VGGVRRTGSESFKLALGDHGALSMPDSVGVTGNPPVDGVVATCCGEAEPLLGRGDLRGLLGGLWSNSCSCRMTPKRKYKALKLSSRCPGVLICLFGSGAI
jgi:hypothetical protein